MIMYLIPAQEVESMLEKIESTLTNVVSSISNSILSKRWVQNFRVIHPTLKVIYQIRLLKTDFNLKT